MKQIELADPGSMQKKNWVCVHAREVDSVFSVYV